MSIKEIGSVDTDRGRRGGTVLPGPSFLTRHNDSSSGSGAPPAGSGEADSHENPNRGGGDSGSECIALPPLTTNASELPPLSKITRPLSPPSTVGGGALAPVARRTQSSLRDGPQVSATAASSAALDVEPMDYESGPPRPRLRVGLTSTMPPGLPLSGLPRPSSFGKLSGASSDAHMQLPPLGHAGALHLPPPHAQMMSHCGSSGDERVRPGQTMSAGRSADFSSSSMTGGRTSAATLDDYRRENNRLVSLISSARVELEQLQVRAADIEREREVDLSKVPRRYWSSDEHARFLEGLRRYGKDMRAISSYVGSRNPTQVRTHAQKYFLRLNRQDKRCMSDGDLFRLALEQQR